MHMANGWNKAVWFGVGALGVLTTLACQEEIVTDLEGDLIPVDAVTVEVSIPYEVFGSDLQGWGGYGRPFELARDIVARTFEGTLDARVLNAWNPYPVFATIRDSTGVFVADSSLTFIGGKLTARFDTLSSVLDGSVELAVSAMPRDWDFRSAAWDVAVDSVGDRQEWEEPGAGPVIQLATATWDPSQGDSVVFQIDSAGVALWADTADAQSGVRVEALTEGVRLDMNSLSYSLTTRPSVDPDTIVNLTVTSRGRTFIYSPIPEPPTDEIRVGGVPAWRSVFTVTMPEFLDDDPELCQKLQCPVKLTGESLISASLILTTSTQPDAYVPVDSLWLDVRPVLEPSRLPKSPLGQSLVGLLGVRLLPEEFGEGAGAEVEIPLGAYIENLIEENSNPDLEVPNTLALLSSFEPLSLYFASFEGPDSPDSPELRLILTFTDEVRVR